LDNRQHLDNFSVGHNLKEGCKGGVAEELAKINMFEKPMSTVAKGQPVRRSYHTTFTNKAT
jgi:hypothetical protein